jgi:hypothetical protein
MAEPQPTVLVVNTPRVEDTGDSIAVQRYNVIPGPCSYNVDGTTAKEYLWNLCELHGLKRAGKPSASKCIENLANHRLGPHLLKPYMLNYLAASDMDHTDGPNDQIWQRLRPAIAHKLPPAVIAPDIREVELELNSPSLTYPTISPEDLFQSTIIEEPSAAAAQDIRPDACQDGRGGANSRIDTLYSIVGTGQSTSNGGQPLVCGLKSGPRCITRANKPAAPCLNNHNVGGLLQICAYRFRGQSARTVT